MTDSLLPPEVPLGVLVQVESIPSSPLRPGELDSWEVHWVRERWARSPGQWMLVGDVVAQGEWFRGWLASEGPISVAGPDAYSNGLVNFTKAFEDFISESRFAWGQQRELEDRPWRRT